VLRSDTIYIVIPMDEEGIHLGYLALASSTRGVREARWSSIQTVVSITLVILLLGIPLTVFWLRSRLRPLTRITASLRQIDLENLAERLPFVGHNEFGYLAETIRAMGTKLNFAQREIVEKERLAKELQIARDIQYSILPRQYPSSPRFEFAGTYQSAKEVGGDYYDFIDFDDEHLAFIIADVSGKSLPGMLVMLLTRDIVKQLTHGIRQPADLLCEVNRELFPNIKEGMFVTMLYGLLNKRTGHCVFASAGHNSLVHLEGASGTCRTIKTRGFPLGLVGPAVFAGRIESGEIMLAQDDWLVAYTDGINEAKNDQGQQFGMDRFLNLLQGKRHLRPGELVHATLEEHGAFVGSAPQYDDITLVALKWRGGVGEPAEEASAQRSVGAV
jgi:sigma-B regulation protein RsbU (phosphoserine phosphatase)